jgi:hypothetical protein
LIGHEHYNRGHDKQDSRDYSNPGIPK